MSVQQEMIKVFDREDLIYNSRKAVEYADE